MEAIPNALVGIAGVYWVCYELSLRGLVALSTVRNTAGVDVLVYNPKNEATAALQVKASLSSRKRGFWPTPAPDKCLRGKGNAWVFLRWDNELNQFQAFLEKADVVTEQVEAHAQSYKRQGKKEFFFWSLRYADEKELKRLMRNWQVWQPK